MNREMLLTLQHALINQSLQTSEITRLYDFLLNQLIKMLNVESALYLKRDPDELTRLILTAVVGNDGLAARTQQAFNLPQEFDELEHGVARLKGPQPGTVLLDNCYQFGMLLPLGETGCIILLSAQAMPFDEQEEEAFRDALEAIGGVVALLEQHYHERQQSCDVEQHLSEARYQSELTNAAKSEFLTRMSHELRTPLNAILGFTQLFEFDDNLSPRQLDNIKEIERAGYLMLELVSEVLDLAKIESGRIEMTMEKVLLNTLVEECRSLVLNQATLRNIQLSMCENCDPLYVHADQTRLKQVLINLLSNAVKYNRPGGSVEISCTGISSNRCRVLVTDSGAGIPENKLDELFQPFNRLGVESAGIEGSGMGLVITKKLIELMGGDIGVESRPGVGTTFWFELQIETAEAMADKSDQLAEEAKAVDTLRILVVEDNPINQNLLRQQLELLGYSADVVSNGKAALEGWRSGGYHGILSDCNMPVMDGYEMAAKIREQELVTHERMPIIAITANVGERERQRCHASGMDAVLSKPLDIKELGDILSKLIGRSAPQHKMTNLVSSEQKQKPAIDSQFLAKLVGGDVGIQQRVLAKFLETTPASIDEIDAAIVANDDQQLKFVAHRLKSSSRSMGGNAMGDCCQSIEHAALDGNWALVVQLQLDLHRLWREFCDYFSRR